MRVGPFVLKRDTVQNTDGDLVLQTNGGSGGVLMLAPEGKVVTDANVTVAGSFSVDGLTANASDQRISTGAVLLHAHMRAPGCDRSERRSDPSGRLVCYG